MKKKKLILCLALALITLCGLTACAGRQPKQLSGSFSAEEIEHTLTYTFEGDSVTAQYTVADHSVVSYDGSYFFNRDRTLITLAFDKTSLGAISLPAGIGAPGGVFSFEEGDGYIKIGSVQYDLQTS